MKNKVTIQTKYNLNIEVLSPVAINDGETLSPLADYFVLDGALHYVDEKEFQKILAEDEVVATRYEHQLLNASKEGVDDFLIQVVQSREKLARISSGKKVEFSGEKTLSFKTIIKSKGKAYIPGSSLKGAIKNAFLYYWLEKEETGKKELEKFVNRFRNSFSERDKKVLIKSFVDEVQKKAFGSREDYLYEPSSHLLVSDSTSLTFENIAVANVVKQSLTDKVEDWDLHTQEYIKEGAQLSFTLGIHQAELDWKAFDQANFFVSQMQSNQENLTAFFDVLNYYHNSLQQFTDGFNLEKPKVHINSNEAILYVGGNKGIYKTTVLLAIRRYFEKNGGGFKEVFGTFLQREKRKNYQDYPNSISHINRQRLGMIRISDLAKSKYVQVNDKTYDESMLKSGNSIEGIIQSIGKPNSEVRVNVEGKEQIRVVKGAKALMKEQPNALQVGSKCVFCWRNNDFYFEKK